ncbi:MAG: response regulator [Spirochaetales bacterium]|jgi:signal transduction histidine kinase/FixJ family two-component response regulator/HPt (histidine-containing phosphotransfer) domain-containing protein|nr:response regulator [Spirochaetales bacterium]
MRNFVILIQENFRQILFVFLAFMLMVLVSFLFVSSIVEDQVRSNAEEISHVIEGKIRSNMREAEVVLMSTAELIRSRMDAGQSVREIRRYIQEMTKWFVRPESNTGVMDIRAYIQGHYITGIGRESPHAYNTWEWPWYIDALAAGDSITRSEPYKDSQSGTLIITLSKTIRSSGGEIYGVLAVPMNLDIIAGDVKRLHFAQRGYGMLLNRNFIILVHPNAKYPGQSFRDISEEHAKIAEELLAAGDGSVSAKRVTDAWGVPVAISFRQIFTGWYIGVATPVSNYYQTAYLMAAILSLLGLAFMCILSLFLIRMSIAKHQSDEENKSKSSFLARMSHEIRTPMNSILGMTELLLRKNISSEINDYLSVISQSGQTLLAIINDILDFSKITAGKLRVEPRKYQVSSMINDTISVIRMRIMEKSLDFLVSVDNMIPAQLIGDDIRIRQILINILNNAIKYTPAGYIALDIRRKNVEKDRMELVLSVSDSGIGIKEEDISHLFSDFTRLDMNRNQHIEGTGLGLVITNILCQAMGGSVSVSSEYGKGSVFTATIPQTFENSKKLALVHEAEKKRILFFEDRPLIFDSIVYSFHNLGLNPICFRNFQDFCTELATGDYEFAFISSRHASECIHIPGKNNLQTQLVILVEVGDISFFREIKSIMMPVYCLPIANVINNVNDEENSKTLRFRFGFSAPAAKILIVDDISSNLRVAKELMAPYKMEIHTCLSGVEAIKLIQQNRYDIVFMDHMMPNMDGLEATAAIRALGDTDEYYRNVPIIALTANAIVGQQDLFLQRKMNDFIAKPIEVKQLNTVLERWIPAEKKIIAKPEEEPVRAAVHIRISGIDTEAGLVNVNNSLDVYMDILGEFCRNAADIRTQIEQARNENSMPLYISSMHALKGMSWSIGALELGDAAEQMEKAAKAADLETLQQKTSDLLRDIAALTSNIHTATASAQTGGAPPEQTDISILRLDDLRQAIASMDIDSVNKMLIEYLSIPMDRNTKDNIDKIEQHILMFEYDHALEIIDRMLHRAD